MQYNCETISVSNIKCIADKYHKLFFGKFAKTLKNNNNNGKIIYKRYNNSAKILNQKIRKIINKPFANFIFYVVYKQIRNCKTFYIGKACRRFKV